MDSRHALFSSGAARTVVVVVVVVAMATAPTKPSTLCFILSLRPLSRLLLTRQLRRPRLLRASSFAGSGGCKKEVARRTSDPPKVDLGDECENG